LERSLGALSSFGRQLQRGESGAGRRSGSLASPLKAAVAASLVATGASGEVLDNGTVPPDVARKIEALLRQEDSGAAAEELLAGGEAASQLLDVAGGELLAESDVSEEAQQGVCTEGNKHIVIAALDVFDEMKNYIAQLIETEPMMGYVLFLLTLILQRFEPPVRFCLPTAVKVNRSV
jgi:hypothetical protein